MLTADILASFAEQGNQQRFRTASGARLQGWIMEVGEDRLVISIGAGEKGEDVSLSLDEIVPDSLEFWDTRSQSWTRFTA